MKNEVHAELKNVVTQKVAINIDPDKLEGKKYSFSVEGKAELRVPKEENDASLLLVSTMDMKADENHEAFSATLVTNFCFSTSEKIEDKDDYDEIVRKQCMPIMQEETKKIINRFLNDMGAAGVIKIGDE